MRAAHALALPLGFDAQDAQVVVELVGMLGVQVAERAHHPGQPPAPDRRHERQEAKVLDQAELPLARRHPEGSDDDFLSRVGLVMREANPLQEDRLEYSLRLPHAPRFVRQPPLCHRVVVEGFRQRLGDPGHIIGRRFAHELLPALCVAGYCRVFCRHCRTSCGSGKSLPRRLYKWLNSVGLLLFGNEPKLLHHAQIIVALPLLDYLASVDAVYGDAFDLYLPASGGAKLLYLSLVITTDRPAGDYLVTFGYRVLDGSVQIGEGGLVYCEELLSFL
jgi:hypothetical protein